MLAIRVPRCEELVQRARKLGKPVFMGGSELVVVSAETCFGGPCRANHLVHILVDSRYSVLMEHIH